MIYGKPKSSGRIKKFKVSRPLKNLARKCTNMRVLNSYWVGQDASFKFYKIIVVDPSHKAIRRDPRINWIVSAKMKHEELRGLNAAGKKRRGMQNR